MSEVSKVVEVMKVMEADEVVVWRHHGMVASPSGGHVWTTHTTSAVHTAHAMHTAHHRVGRHHRRGKHRHHDSASDCYFVEHDTSPFNLKTKLMLASFAPANSPASQTDQKEGLRKGSARRWAAIAACHCTFGGFGKPGIRAAKFDSCPKN